MYDLIYIGAMVAFFVISGFYALGCAKL